MQFILALHGLGFELGIGIFTSLMFPLRTTLRKFAVSGSQKKLGELQRYY